MNVTGRNPRHVKVNLLQIYCYLSLMNKRKMQKRTGSINVLSGFDRDRQIHSTSSAPKRSRRAGSASRGHRLRQNRTVQQSGHGNVYMSGEMKSHILFDSDRQRNKIASYDVEIQCRKPCELPRLPADTTQFPHREWHCVSSAGYVD